MRRARRWAAAMRSRRCSRPPSPDRRAGLWASASCSSDVTLDILLPDKFKRTEEMSFGQGGPSVTRVSAVNGTEVWDDGTNRGGGGSSCAGRADQAPVLPDRGGLADRAANRRRRSVRASSSSRSAA